MKRLLSLTFLAVAGTAIAAPATDWTLLSREIYPTMLVKYSLMFYNNWSSGTVTVPSESVDWTLYSWCTGSENSAAPWSTPFSALCFAGDTWEGTAGGP